MSSIVSRRPSSRNHWNEAFWMSIRLGRSRTCFRREYDLRARGAATLVAKKRASLEKAGVQCESAVSACEDANVRDVGATRQGTEETPSSARAAGRTAVRAPGQYSAGRKALQGRGAALRAGGAA